MHAHTVYSLHDGEQSVRDIILKAWEQGVKVLCITDHNSVSAYEEIEWLRNNDPKIAEILQQIKIIPGIELDAIHDGIPIHVLGFGIDLKKIQEDSWLSDYQSSLNPRDPNYHVKVSEKLRELGLEVSSIESIDAEYERLKTDKPNIHPGKAFVKDFENNIERLNELGIDPENYHQFIKSLQSPKSLEEISKRIKESGGKVILAHPFKYNDKSYEGDTLDKKAQAILDHAIQSELIDGIEVYHGGQTVKQIEFLEKYIQGMDKEILVSGGSDSHELNQSLAMSYMKGEQYPTQNDEELVPPQKVNNLLEQIITINEQRSQVMTESKADFSDNR